MTAEVGGGGAVPGVVAGLAEGDSVVSLRTEEDPDREHGEPGEERAGRMETRHAHPRSPPD